MGQKIFVIAEHLFPPNPSDQLIHTWVDPNLHSGTLFGYRSLKVNSFSVFSISCAPDGTVTFTAVTLHTLVHDDPCTVLEDIIKNY